MSSFSCFLLPTWDSCGHSDALKDKTETQAQYEAYVRETEPLRKELGIMTADELYERPCVLLLLLRCVKLSYSTELPTAYRSPDHEERAEALLAGV